VRNWRTDIEESLRDFLAHEFRAGIDVEVEFLSAPHEPPQLPEGKMAVLGFWQDGEWLLIGTAGPNSGPRYSYQHYNLWSAKSTLAKHLTQDPEMHSLVGSDCETIRDWIKASTNRVNILLPATADPALPRRLKVFLLARLHPRLGR